MKKIVLMLLFFVFLLSLSSCHNDNTSDAEDKSTVSSGEEETASEEDKIKNSVLDLMQTSELQKDPTELFSHFAGDFQITNFTVSQDRINSIKRKEAVTLVDSGVLRYYGVEAAGHMFYAADYAQESEVVGVLALAADASKASTIFTVFGLDTSALYTATTDNSKAEALTSDMLTVSEDKKLCQFDKAYVDAIAEKLCETMGFTGSVKSSFMNKYTGSGIYSVAENQVTFDIQIKDNQIGSIHQIMKYAIDDEDKVYVYSYMKYSNANLGIKTPIVTEIECKDVVYRDNDPVSATIKMKNSSQSSFKDGGVTVKVIDDIETTFRLDCTNLDTRSATVTRKKKTTETALGETYTYNSSLSLLLDLGKSGSQFRFTKKEENETTISLIANKVTFSASPAIVTPQRVTNVITAYINKHF